MIDLLVNGKTQSVRAELEKPLLWVLRDDLGLKGTKYGCGNGICGACVVLLDGEPNHACMVPLSRVGKRSVTTIEGIPPDHPVIQAWIDEQVPQCGYCQPGQILSAVALLAREPTPSDAAITTAAERVLCRCGTYQRIRRAIRAATQPSWARPPPRRFSALFGDPAPGVGIAMNQWIAIDPGNTVTLSINHSEMGQGALTGLVALFAEELEIDPGTVRTVFAPAAAGFRNPLFDEQLTGGSSSIRGEWIHLRECAAQTRLRLVQAAARRWRANIGECRAEAGMVHHVPSGRKLDYGALAHAANRLPIPKRVRLKQVEEFRVIGKRLPRLDIPAMVLGRTRYGIDTVVDGTLVASLARCPIFGGRVKRIDERGALAVTGVRRVVRMASGIAVVADDFWSALRGRDTLRIEWFPGANATLDKRAIEYQLMAALERRGTVANERGHALDAIARHGQPVEAVYLTPYLAHATIEPMNCTAHVHDGDCDVWVGTQNQEETQLVAAQIADVPRSRVRVHTQYLGGGFGRRLDTDFVAEAVELSRKLGVPVQVIWTRADDLQHDHYRPAHAMRIRAVTDDRGFPSAWWMHVAGPDLALDGIDVPYAMRHLRETHMQVDCGVPTGPWRSVGASNNAFAIESFIDELAALADRDPLEYRLALLDRSPRHARVLRAAAQRAGWGSPIESGRGRGIAVYESFGSIVAAVAEVSVAAGRIAVDRVVCAIDCGIAVVPDAVHAQLEGGVAFALSAALKEEMTIDGGRVLQQGFDDYPILSFAEMPRVETHILQSTEAPGGAGEPPVPVIAPAVSNAVFGATRRRLRRLPLRIAAEEP